MLGPCSWIARRGKHNFNALFDDDGHVLFDIRVEQGHVDTKRFIGGGFAFADMFAQNIWVHTARANQSQSTGIAHCSRQFPATAPNHTDLYNGILNIEKMGDSVQSVYQLELR